MATSNLPGMGYLPDIPSVKDFTESTPEIAGLLRKTALRAQAPEATAGKPAGRGGGAAAAPAGATKVDLRARFSPIEDQGQLGSCTANAAVALVEYYERRASGKHIDASRLFVYKVTRNLLGWTGDTGAYIRSAMGALVLFGAPPERYWPYDGRPAGQNEQLDAEPSSFCYAFAADFKAIKYLRLDPNGASPSRVLQNVKDYIASGLPAMFGFPVYDEFMSPPASGHVAFPTQSSTLYGGHAIVACGYDDDLQIGTDRGALLIRNSWGTGWGLGGYAWMSYRYVSEGLANDFWTLIKEAWVDTGNF